MTFGKPFFSGLVRSSFRLSNLLRFRILRSPSIGTRLVTIVLATGLIAFALIGTVTLIRLDLGLKMQANSFGEWSERQLSDRLDGEAQLAKARLEVLGDEASQYLRQIAQRTDVAKAVVSANDITLRELLVQVLKTSDLSALIAFDTSGVVIGANAPPDLLAVNSEIKPLVGDELQSILKSNSRSRPRGFNAVRELPLELLVTLNWPNRLAFAHIAIEPVFDDFGELIGALGAIRLLAKVERTLEHFSSLSNAGVVVLSGSTVVSSAGPANVTFDSKIPDAHALTRSSDKAHVARCADYDVLLKVCTFTDATVLTATRDRIFKIGAEQTQSMMQQFLLSAAATLVLLVIGLLFGVRHAIRGLSTLASAAKSVAAGDVDVPFNAQGVGEVYSLSVAFERMLANLRASMSKISQLAFFDTVTGLSNREKIRIDAGEIIHKSTCGTLFYLDLDGFKSINDTFGHKTGDLLLKKVAERLSQSLGKEFNAETAWLPMLARIGGDEFVVLLPTVVDKVIVARIAGNLIEALRDPFEVGGPQLIVGGSLGVTSYPADGETYEELLINSDLAMYAAKARGRNTFAVYTQEIGETAKERIFLENELRAAIRNDQLSVHYQPKVSCVDGRVCGVEALVRWTHPQLGKIPPDKFIGIAEEAGLIGDLDRFVLRRSLTEIGELIETGSDIVLSVNVSAVELEDPRFSTQTLDILKEMKFPPTRIEFEITESVAMRDPKAVFRRIASLRKCGIRFAIDDFGAGYSNLATLARLPVDTLKIDRSLITNVAKDREKQIIVRITLSLAKQFGFQTVAEGVETAEDLHFLSGEGATMIQGFYFSPALPYEEIAAVLQPRRLGAIAKKLHNVALFQVRRLATSN